MGGSCCGSGVCGRGILVVGRDGATPGVCGGTARPAPAGWREWQCADEPEPSSEGRGMRACLPRCAPTTALAPLPCAAALLRTCASGPCLIFGSQAHSAGPRVLAAFRRCCACMRPDCTRVEARAPGYAAVRPAAQPWACTPTKMVCETKVQKPYSPFSCGRGAPLRPVAGHPQGDRATTKSKLYAPATSRLDWREYRSRLIKVSS